MSLTLNFLYNDKGESKEVAIQTNENEKIEGILNKFYCKTHKKLNSYLFLYNGKEMIGNLLIKDIINIEDKKRKKMSILTYEKTLEESEDIILVNINYKSKNTEIKCYNPNEKMSTILNEFSTKNDVDIKNLYFFYMGRIIFDKFEINQYLNFDEKERKKMDISVIEKDNKASSLTKSKQIICPICGELAKFKFKNFKISIYGCEYNHQFDDMDLDDFENSQLLDISQIICDQCKENNRSNKQIFHCFSCKKNICPSCKIKHNKEHSIVDYDYMYYYCENHNEKYSSFCETCHKNICESCIDCFDNHKSTYLRKILV